MSKRNGIPKKPFVLRLIEGIVVFAVVVVLAAAGTAAFFCVRDGIDPIALFGQVDALNAEYGEADIAAAKATESDLASADAKFGSIGSSVSVTFTDKEVEAYIAENGLGADLGAAGCEAALLRISFSDAPADNTGSDLCTFGYVVRVDLSGRKDEKMSLFPLNLFRGKVPDAVCVSGTVALKRTGGGFTAEPKSASLNGLSPEDSENVFKVLRYALGYDGFSEFNAELGGVAAGAVLSDAGFFGAAQKEGAKNFGFTADGEKCLLKLYCRDTEEKKTITYNGTKGAENSNPVEYTVMNDVITLSPLSAEGYNFEGWFKDEALTESITEIDAETFEDYTVYAKWSLVTYEITLDLSGGQLLLGGETITYTIESEDFVLPSPFKIVGGIGCEFLGWIGEGLTDVTPTVKIVKGSFGDKAYKAVYDGDVKTVTFNVDGVDLASADADIGAALAAEALPDWEKLGFSGYSVKKWYTSPEMITEYDFDSKVFYDTTVYGSFDYVVDKLLFYPYTEKFALGIEAGKVDVATRDELKAYIDYAYFYGVSKEVNLDLLYFAGTGKYVRDEVQEVFDEYYAGDRFSPGSIKYGIGAIGSFGRFHINTEGVYTSPVAVLDEAREYTYSQVDYALKMTAPDTRGAEYSAFNRSKVGKKIAVTNSEQLVWAIENGYDPVCASGSAAEKVYEKAKNVLKKICSDEMSEFDKLRAIYEWIIMNVEYDNYALEQSSEGGSISADEVRKYDSWYAEGVFDSGKAVCEGFSKALIIMAGVENIPAIYVTGNSHAWNRVYLDGKWYVVDATHGNVEIKAENSEIFTYNSFLITDEEKSYRGYTSEDFKDYAATTAYATYAAAGIDREIKSASDLARVLKSVKGYTPDSGDCYTVDVFFTKENADNFSTWLSAAKAEAMMTFVDMTYTTDRLKNGDTVYVLVIGA